MMCERIEREIIERDKGLLRHTKAGPWRVVGWGDSQGERALVYSIPPRPGTKKLSKKRIRCSVFEKALVALKRGELTRTWFDTFPESNHGRCNFIILGIILERLGLAEPTERGGYRYKGGG